MPASDLKTIYQLDLTYRANNQGIKHLTVADSTIVDSLAKGQGLASVFAKNMIHFLYHKMPQKRIGKLNTSSGQRKMKPTIDYSEILPEKDIYFYPNPASEVITIVNNSTIAISTIAIYNSVGTLISQQNYKTFAQQLQLDILNLAAGTYNLVITNSYNQTILNEKVLINRH